MEGVGPFTREQMSSDPASEGGDSDRSDRLEEGREHETDSDGYDEDEEGVQHLGVEDSLGHQQGARAAAQLIGHVTRVHSWTVTRQA